MEHFEIMLKNLADDPDDYIHEGKVIVFYHHGKEVQLEMVNLPSVGPSVKIGDGDFVPISMYVQDNILDLPTLSTQIYKVLTKKVSLRPIPFIDGPGSIITSEISSLSRIEEGFIDTIEQQIFGSTHIIQLMAGAGRGKTVLLEQLGIKMSEFYKVDNYPTPILLLVDLLGRYVGSVSDAIAGTLNNTFSFPSLTQKDVVTAIKNGWIVLALDGFDELVARIGLANAFNHISDLLDQLESSGTIILSARDSFFDLYEISSAIKTYLSPKTGSYTTTTINLGKWNNIQGIEVFKRAGSAKPENELYSVCQFFDNDLEIVYHPFFITRLAVLLTKKGEGFNLGKDTTRFERIKWIIETFIDRENKNKWVDRDGNRLLADREHARLLGTIAEEMWRTGAFRLTAEEVRIAVDIALSDQNVPKARIDDVKSRILIHAAISKTGGRYYTFFHDQFFHYYFAINLSQYIQNNDQKALVVLLNAQELSATTIMWVAMRLDANKILKDSIETLNSIASSSEASATLRNNIALLVGTILDKKITENNANIVVSGQMFDGESLSSRRYENISFSNCQFWQTNLEKTHFNNILFNKCEFDRINVSDDTVFNDVTFSYCIIKSLRINDERSLYSPSDIATYLHGRNCNLIGVDENDEAIGIRDAIDSSAIGFVEKLVRYSLKNYNIWYEELVESYDDYAQHIIKMASRVGVLKEVAKDTSGAKKTFFRFNVDRQKLLDGLVQETDDNRINEFWSEMQNLFSND